MYIYIYETNRNLRETHGKTLYMPEHCNMYIHIYIMGKIHEQIGNYEEDIGNACTYQNTTKTTIVNKYTVQYYFGGYKRMRALRKLFRVLKVWNIDTCILTNNSRAKREPDSFTKALSFIGASWVEIIHTSDTKMSYMKKKQWI